MSSGCDVSDVLGERPTVTFGILCSIRAITVELVGKLVDHMHAF